MVGFGSSQDSNLIVRYENGEFTTFGKGKGFEGSVRYFFSRATSKLTFSTDKGHFRYEDGRFVKFEAVSSVSGSAICYIDRKGGIWLIDEEKGLRRVLGDKVDYFGFGLKSANNFRSIYEDRFGQFWIGVSDDKTYRVHNGKAELITDKFWLRTAIEDVEGNFWLGKEDGLYKIKSEDFESGKIDFEKAEKYANEDGLPASNVVRLKIDRDGAIWAGTYQGGVTRITPQKFVVFAQDSWGGDRGIVYPILEDHKGRVWFGNWTNGKDKRKSLIRYDSDGIFKTFPLNPFGNAVSALYQDSNNRIWVGGVDRFGYFGSGDLTKKGSFVRERSKRVVHAIAHDSGGSLWVGTNKGLFKFQEGENEEFTKEKDVPDDYINVFLNTKQGAFWVGTRKGLAVLKKGKLRHYTVQDDLNNDHIRSLYEDATGVIWIGTYESGLLRFNNGEFKRISQEDGLSNGNVFCTLEDDNGWFWINSNNGIYRVQKQQLNDFADGKIDKVNSISYNKKDGLLSMEGNGGKQPAGIKRKKWRTLVSYSERSCRNKSE